MVKKFELLEKACSALEISVPSKQASVQLMIQTILMNFCEQISG